MLSKNWEQKGGFSGHLSIWKVFLKDRLCWPLLNCWKCFWNDCINHYIIIFAWKRELELDRAVSLDNMVWKLLKHDTVTLIEGPTHLLEVSFAQLGHRSYRYRRLSVDRHRCVGSQTIDGGGSGRHHHHWCHGVASIHGVWVHWNSL